MKNFKETIFKKIAEVGHKAGELGVSARKRVFGFRLRSTVHTDRRVLPVKLLHDHRILQRWHTHRRSGGERSTIAQHALDKARHGSQQS